jgi:hypothetical protein
MTRRIILVLSGMLVSLSIPVGAATFVISPSTVPNLSLGAISLQIGGLTNGESVLIERFLDSNGNGVIDAGEPLVQSFTLTDGRVASIGGVRNRNIPGDDDLLSNGQISSALNFQAGPEFSRGSSTQLLRMSSPTGRFSPVQQTLTVTQSVLAQQITGTVSSGGIGVPFAPVGLLMQVGTDNEFISATIADSAGNFVLYVTNGTYQVIGFKHGYIGNFSTSPLVTIAGANTNVLVPLSAASLNLSGNVTDADTSLGLSGFQFFATSGNNDYTAFFSDAQGNFSIPINTGKWKIEPSDFSALLGGYFRLQTKPSVSIGTVDVTGMNVPLTKGTAMIFGSLKTDQNVALPAVRLFGSDSGNLFQSTCYTDTNGNFFLPANASTWYFGVDGQGAGLPAGYVVQQVQLTLTNGQPVLTNLVAQRVSAYLAGKAIDSNNNPITGGNMIGFGPNGQNAGASIANDGTFALPASAGTWTVSLDSQTAAGQNLVGPQLSFNVTDGVNISNISYVAVVATRTITGTVHTATNTAVTGVFVFANATVNGTNYNATGTTDGGGNYFLPVLAGQWSVGLDSQTLVQRGFSSVTSHNVDTSAGNQTANFIVGGQPTLAGTASLSGGNCQFVLNGAPGQNYTIQFSTNLAFGVWNRLYITNSGVSPVLIVDPNATNAARFYRVLVGP